jgi:hypothetical protein
LPAEGAVEVCCAFTPVKTDEAKTTAIAATKRNRLRRVEKSAKETERKREIMCGMGEPLELFQN